MKQKTTTEIPDASRRQAIKKLLAGSIGVAGIAASPSFAAKPAVNPGWERNDQAYVGQEGKR